MATTVATYEFAGHVSRVVRFVSDFSINLERYRATRETRKMLLRLTDAQLEDIGLTRGEVLRRY